VSESPPQILQIIERSFEDEEGDITYYGCEVLPLVSSTYGMYTSNAEPPLLRRIWIKFAIVKSIGFMEGGLDAILERLLVLIRMVPAEERVKFEKLIVVLDTQVSGFTLDYVKSELAVRIEEFRNVSAAIVLYPKPIMPLVVVDARRLAAGY
jgi:hypothetical protein